MFLMTVQDFLDMFTDPDAQRFELWDNENEEIKFSGYISDIPDDMEDIIFNAEVTSIDLIEKGRDTITLNVDF